MRGLLILSMLAALPALILLPMRWVNPPVSSYMLQADSALAQRSWIELEQMGVSLPLAAIAAEDQKFPLHHGFDLEALAEVLGASGAPRRGASSISQQTSKNLFLWPGGYLRKGLEAWITLWMELLWSKPRILEVYLNIAEFGPGVYGVWAGAHHHFGLAPQQLSRHQAARMMALLPSPRRLTPDHAAVLERARWIEQQMQQLGEAYLPRPG